MRGLQTEPTASVVIGGTRWFRTCAVATTSSLSTRRRCSGWPPHSTNSYPPSDQPRPQVPPQHGLRSSNATEPLEVEPSNPYRASRRSFALTLWALIHQKPTWRRPRRVFCAPRNLCAATGDYVPGRMRASRATCAQARRGNSMSVERLLELLSPYRTFSAADEGELRAAIAAAGPQREQPLPYGW
jgi:hypothetical protein